MPDSSIASPVEPRRDATPAARPRPYLAILSCAAVSGVYFAIAIVPLVLYVNPYLSASAEVVGHLVFYLLPVYGISATILATLFLSALARLGLVRPRGLFDPVLLSWLFVASLGLMATIYWLNFQATEVLISPQQRAHLMRVTAGLTSACAAAAIALGLQRLYPESRRLVRVLLLLLAVLTQVFLFAERRENLGAPARRFRILLDVAASGTPMTILAFDGLSLDQLRPIEAQGSLPSFGKLLREGAAVRLETVLPCEPIVTFTTVATGKLPHRHLVSGNFTFTIPGLHEGFRITPRAIFFKKLLPLGILKASPTTRTDRDALAYWNIFARAGVRVGVVNWPATFPAETLRGFIVSDYLERSYFQLGQGLSKVTSPERLAPLVLQHRVTAEEIPDALVSGLIRSADPNDPHEASLRSILRDARARDATSRAAARILAAAERPQVLTVRFDGLENILRAFLRYHDPEAFGNVSSKDRDHYGRVVPGYFALIDDLVSEELARLPPGGILVVLSASGMEPASFLERTLSSGDPLFAGSRKNGPDGAMLLWGKDIVPGAALSRRIVDVAPTLLYAQGLPIPRDMDGDPLFEVFTDEYKSRTPVSSIASYEAARIGPTAGARERPLVASPAPAPRSATPQPSATPADPR